MKYTFVPMNQEYASRIVATWKYEQDYSLYDYSNEADHIFDREGWGRGIFAVLDEAEDLVGELSIEFYDAQGQVTEYLQFEDPAVVNERELWIGFGLRPDLVDHGLGVAFVRACVEFAIHKYSYRGEFIRLGVATFNQRAVKTYERAGFSPFERTVAEINGKAFECVHMRKKR